ncbi:MAG: hypoxanthine phosphoribosyltransferase [Clostridiales Family XIII bacterium]|jgi:hypoxanthine phosphoribosyltransferase|nr:hypoxanthine phosphoribosyltransferase [Clostridiales Family XIII bacterium]
MAESKSYKLEKILISKEEIDRRAAEIGRLISEDLAGETVLVVGILKGAFLWMGNVIQHITIPVKIDFMAVSSYGAATKSSGVVRILKDLDSAIEGQNVIVVEDIVDSGVTLAYLKESLLGRGPKSLRICTLLDKPEGRRTEIQADYTGFTVGDAFIVGYGLDVDQQFRNLPYITSVSAG